MPRESHIKMRLFGAPFAPNQSETAADGTGQLGSCTRGEQTYRKVLKAGRLAVFQNEPNDDGFWAGKARVEMGKSWTYRRA